MYLLLIDRLSFSQGQPPHQSASARSLGAIAKAVYTADTIKNEPEKPPETTSSKRLFCGYLLKPDDTYCSVPLTSRTWYDVVKSKALRDKKPPDLILYRVIEKEDT